MTDRIKSLLELTRLQIKEIAQGVGKSTVTVDAVLTGKRPEQHYSRVTEQKIYAFIEAHAAKVRDGLNRLSGGEVHL